MTKETVKSDDLLDDIDAGRLQPMMHAVVRKLHNDMQTKDHIQEKILASFDHGESFTELEVIQNAIWSKIDALDVKDQSGFRLSNCLTKPDQAVDWELAEYLMLWAGQQGISEQKICDAFGAKTNGS